MMAARSWIQLFTTPLRLVKTASAWSRYSAGMQPRRTLLGTAVLGSLLAMGIARAQQPLSLVEELHELVHASKFTELATKVDAVHAQDTNWKAILELLIEAGERQGGYDYLSRKAKYILDTNKDVETRATAAFALATGSAARLSCSISGHPGEASVRGVSPAQGIPCEVPRSWTCHHQRIDRREPREV